MIVLAVGGVSLKCHPCLSGLIQIRPVVATQSVQNVITVPASGVAAAAGAAPGAAVAAANAPGQVLVTAQSVHQPGKVSRSPNFVQST